MSKPIIVPEKLYPALRRAIDFAVARMHLEDDEIAGLRALSDDILLQELGEDDRLFKKGETVKVSVSRTVSGNDLIEYSFLIQDQTLNKLIDARGYIGYVTTEAINAVNRATGEAEVP